MDVQVAQSKQKLTVGEWNWFCTLFPQKFGYSIATAALCYFSLKAFECVYKLCMSCLYALCVWLNSNSRHGILLKQTELDGHKGPHEIQWILNVKWSELTFKMDGLFGNSTTRTEWFGPFVTHKHYYYYYCHRIFRISSIFSAFSQKFPTHLLVFIPGVTFIGRTFTNFNVPFA